MAGQTGLEGETGPRGLTGLQGQTGAVGSPGQTGVQGQTGPLGQTGLQGQTGLAGGQGQTGVAGQTGLQGVTGPRGVTGIQGQTGPLGQTGPQGTTGVEGATGPLASGARIPLGGGVQGNLHFTTDSILNPGENIILANDFTVDANVTVQTDPADLYLIVYIAGKLTMGANSKVVCWPGTQTPGGDSGGGFDGGPGGFGAHACGAVFFFVNDASGRNASSRIGGAEDGGNGQPGGTSSSPTQGGLGNDGTFPDGLGAWWNGLPLTTVLPTRGINDSGGSHTGPGGNKGTSIFTTQVVFPQALYNIRRFIYLAGIGVNSFTVTEFEKFVTSSAASAPRAPITARPPGNTRRAADREPRAPGCRMATMGRRFRIPELMSPAPGRRAAEAAAREVMRR